MRLLIHKNYENLRIWASSLIIKRVREFAPNAKKPFVIALPTGSSPLGVYRNLISAYRAGEISFENVVSFNLDEYLGLSGEHPQSYRHYMNENFFSHIDIKPENIHIPNGMASDPDAECLAYEQAIKTAGGIHLLMGGIGANGHIAFNEPGSSMASRTRVQILDINTREANSRFFDGDIAKVPSSALTMGIGTIMEAEEILIVISGSSKARALQAVVEGSVNAICPLSAIQMHANAIIACDEEAAAELKYATINYFKDIEKSNIDI